MFKLFKEEIELAGKKLTLETGKKIQAPLFIKAGERLKVDTREGKYMERVNK